METSDDAIYEARSIGYRDATCERCGKPCKAYPQEPGCPKPCSFCSDACEEAFRAEFIPIGETLPGGRYDGIWEDSGLGLKFKRGDGK